MVAVVRRNLMVPHRFTVDDWHHMIEAGVLGPRDRVELIEGMVVEMAPQSEEHLSAIARLNWTITRALPEGYLVRPQGPITLRPDSEPEPDIVVVTEAAHRQGRPHPSTAPLVIEVAKSSLDFDRTVKLPLYARAGVLEYWIVDVAKRVVEVYRHPLPKSGRYKTKRVVRSDQTLTCSTLPGISIPVASIFK